MHPKSINSLKRCLLTLFTLYSIQTYAADNHVETVVAKWQDNKPAALLIYFDDSHPSHLINAIPELKKRGLVGTFYINPGTKHFKAKQKQWEAVIKKCEMEFANHSMTHKGALDCKQYLKDVEDCSNYIKKLSPRSMTSPLLSYGRPGVPPSNWRISANEHDDILQKAKLIKRMEFNMWGSPKLKTVAQACKLVNDTIKAGDVGVILFHGVGGGWWSIDKPSFVAFVAWLKKHQHQLWVTGAMSLYKYQTERNNLTISTVESTAKSIKLKLTTPLDSKLYDQPLTLITTVPSGWEKCQIEQNSNTSVVKCLENKIIYNILPDNCTIMIHQIK